MKLALIGYGKMGKAIEEIAIAKGHDIALKITSKNPRDFVETNLKKCDVAIEFTTPESAVYNVQKCLSLGIPVVCGSTGWLDKLEEVKAFCTEHNGALLYASNFSVGVNLFFKLNEFLARLMGNRNEYNASTEEIHHTQKKDAPSGTAITVADQILQHIKTKKHWVNAETKSDEALQIISKRIDPAPGTHKVFYKSEVDDIEISHTAHSRKGFASGALLAAEFLQNKKGIFTMSDVLGL